MKAHDLRAKDQGELREQLTSLLHEQFNLRMQKGSGQLNNPQDLRRVRRNIARIQTVLNEKSKEGTTA
jgi:large subunit ribosomal protein L29